MAINPSIGGVYGARIEGVFDGSIAVQNQFHLQKVDGGTITEGEFLDDMLDWATALLAIIKAVQSTIMIWNGVTLSSLEGIPQTVQGDFPSPIPGEISGAVLPSGCACLSYFNTGYSRRQLRKYWGGFPELQTASADGEWGSGTVSVVADVNDFLMTDYVGTNGTWRYGHYTSEASPQFVFPTSGVVQSIVSYQRRRRRGRGI